MGAHGGPHDENRPQAVTHGVRRLQTVDFHRGKRKNMTRRCCTAYRKTLLRRINKVSSLSYSELQDMLRFSSPMRLLGDGGIIPSRPLEGSKTSVITP
ncbi:hypothetical protein U9M48_025884 [Paspalum notatum var. saurae]|uniref:Uncharacterized protein n=1 Tax=Paspalum notatum var. saurae TaxID=547442 RepID=A0AAQ3TW11_PASNO